MRLRPILTAVLLGALALPVGATVIARRITPSELTAGAARIVHARVLDVRSGRDGAGLPATWITLDVARTLKGAGASRLTIKQYGVAAPLADGTVTRIPGLARWAAGDEVVLFLHGESARGFTSPVGLAQGVYRVQRANGRAVVRDDLGGPARSLESFLDETAARVGK
jgi:hypothetical protein